MYYRGASYSSGNYKLKQLQIQHTWSTTQWKSNYTIQPKYRQCILTTNNGSCFVIHHCLASTEHSESTLWQNLWKNTKSCKKFI